MDLEILGTVTFNWDFFSGLVGIILINVVLSGDNAVVIAMAVRSLPREKRRQGIIIGTAGAVVLRIILTFFVARFLQTPYLKMAGGAIILWLAAKLFADVNHENDDEVQTSSVWQAFKIIVIADVTMSLDNVLGVGAASRGNLSLLFFGLATSIPIMVFTSSLLSMLMDRYPIIVYVGAGLLGKVGAEMVLTDPVVIPYLPHSELFAYVMEGLTAIGVIMVGKLLVRLPSKRKSLKEKAALCCPLEAKASDSSGDSGTR
jgi:YjbE family integral membrane protein